MGMSGRSVNLTTIPAPPLFLGRFSKEKVLFILHVMIGMLFSPLMQLNIIIYGLVRKCVKLSPFS